MKIEFKFIEEIKVDDDTWHFYYMLLSLLVVFGYGGFIGYLLDSSGWTFILTIGVFFILIFGSGFLSRIKIRRLK